MGGSRSPAHKNLIEGILLEYTNNHYRRKTSIESQTIAMKEKEKKCLHLAQIINKNVT